MTIPEAIDVRPPPSSKCETHVDPRELTFDRTVDRKLVHRTALSEVFVTDSVGDADRFAVGAQLPSSHAYYTDHVIRGRIPDAVLLLECCRQAETLGAHRFLGRDLDTKFVLQSWSIDVPGLVDVVMDTDSAEIVVVVEPSVRRRGGHLRCADYRIEVSMSGRRIGTAEMTVSYLSGATYRSMRRKQRGSQPPLSSEVEAQPLLTPCAPELVGRANPDNVVLLALRVSGSEVVALVRAAVNHPSLFDHCQDHLPGMTLMEAARQAAIVAAEEFSFGPAEYVSAIGFDADFRAYAELDRATVVRASRPKLDGSGEGDACAVEVTFEQNSVTVALVRVRLTTLPAGV